MNMRFNKSTVSMAFKVSAIPLLMNLVAACSPVNFSTVENNGPGVVTNATPTPTPPGQTCTIETVYRKTKIMFVVDASGSNAEETTYVINNVARTYRPSDQAKTFRGGAINNFFTTYQHKTNFSWGFATFQEASAQTYIGSNANPMFASNPSDMRNAINGFYGASDYGKTPYAAGIKLATRAIQIDPELNSADKPNYFVILLSDGFPTDYVQNGDSFNAAQMRSDVATLRSVAPGRVTLSTIYYAANNQQIQEAISALQQTAAAGGGKFANVDTSSNTFKIDDVISTQEVCK